MSAKGYGLFRCSGRAVKNVPKCHSMQRRPFSNSLARSKPGVVPTFTPTSSPELDKLLALFREKYIMPAYLSRAQRDLIYKLKNKRMLETEQVKTVIGEEEFQLKHINIFVDLPRVKSCVLEVMNLMEERKDWENVIPLLEGLHKGHSNLVKGNNGVQLARKMVEKDREDILFEALRRTSDTGLKLSTPGMTLIIMRGFFKKAYKSGWEAGATKQSLTWAEMVLDMLELPKHKPIRRDSGPRTDPEIIGTPLLLAAVRASRHLDGKDEDGKVEQYAKRLVAVFGNLEAPPEKPTLQNGWLARTVPMLNGMKIAQKVLDPTSETAFQLVEKHDKLRRSVMSTYEQVAHTDWAKGAQRLGIDYYRGQLGPE